MAGKRKVSQGAVDEAEGRKGDDQPGSEGLKAKEDVQAEAGTPSEAVDRDDLTAEDVAEGRGEPTPGSENLKPAEDVQPEAGTKAEDDEDEPKKKSKKKVKDGEVEARLLFDSIGWANPDWNPDDMHRGQRSTKTLYAEKANDPVVSLPEAEYDRLEALGAVEPA